MSKADAKAQKRQKFEAVFVTLRDELLEHFAAQGMPEDAKQWYRRVSRSSKSHTGAAAAAAALLNRGGNGGTQR